MMIISPTGIGSLLRRDADKPALYIVKHCFNADFICAALTAVPLFQIIWSSDSPVFEYPSCFTSSSKVSICLPACVRLSIDLSVFNIKMVFKYEGKRHRSREMHNYSSFKSETWMGTEQVRLTDKPEWQKEVEGPPFPSAPTESSSSPQTRF